MTGRLALRLFNLLWFTTAAAIIGVAILVAISREILPQLDLSNKALLQYLNRHAGAQIEATDLRLQWVSVYPEISAKQLLIDTGDAHVQLDNVLLTINLLRSLWKRSPVVDQLKLSRADVYLQLPETSSTEPTDVENEWRFVNLLLNNDVQISNIGITLQRKDWQRKLELDDLRVQNTFGNKKIFLRVLGNNNAQSLRITGEFSGDSLSDSTGVAYLKTDNLQLDEWIPALAQKGSASGEAWLRWDGRKKADFVANLQFQTAAGAVSHNNIQWPSSLTGKLAGHWEKNGTRYLDIHTLNTPSIALNNIRIANDSDSPDAWRIAIPALPLDNAMQAVDLLPAGAVRTLFASLNPRGYLRNIHVVWNNSKPLLERMQLQANADNISTGAWEGVPAFTGVSGYINSGIGYGYIDLDSTYLGNHSDFSMHYTGIYHEPIVFQRAAGRVQWQWQPDEKTVLVGSDYASLSGEAGEARGSFWLHLPLQDADFHSELYLSIGLRNSQAKYRNMLIPFVLPHDLLEWLKTSIGDAQVSDAGFLYRGGVTGAETQGSAIQFYANIQNGALQFHPQWPPLKQIDAHLLVDDDDAYIRAHRAQMYNTDISSAFVAVRSQHPGLLIDINGRAQGAPDDGLRLLRDTPLHHAIGTGMDQWKIPQGSLNTALALQIPLSGSKTPQDENVQLQLRDALLNMEDLRLPFHKVNSDIHYDTNTGLNAPDIAAELFGKAVKASITSAKTEHNTTININAYSSVNIKDLTQWSGIKPLALLSGTTDYQAALTLGPFSDKPTAQIGQLQITSDLKYIVAPLPEPFGKIAGSTAPLKLTVNLLRDNQQQYLFNYNQQITGALLTRNGALSAGNIALLSGDAALPTSTQNTLRISGTLPNADIQQWVDLIASHNRLPSTSTSSSNTLFPVLDISATQSTWKDINFPALQLSAEHTNDAWQLTVRSDNAQGKALFYDDNRTPDIIVDTLKIQRSNNNASAENNTASNSNTDSNVDFSQIPALNIRIDHLVVDDMDIGQFSTQLRSTANALRFEKLMATGHGYWLRDGSGTSGGTLIWRRTADGKSSSEFHGLLQMSGKQPALEHLGVDPFIIGKQVSLFADITWPGAPQEATLHNVAGNIYTEGKDGKYLQAKPNVAMHALGIMNIATWVRRLQLDFSDLSNDGISFDEYQGKLLFGNGAMQFVEPLEIKSPASAFKLSGKMNLDTDTLDLHLIATLPVGNNATWIAALAGGLPAAAGVYLVSKIFDKQIDQLTSLSYSITGPMSDPDIKFTGLTPLQQLTKKITNSSGATK